MFGPQVAPLAMYHSVSQTRGDRYSTMGFEGSCVSTIGLLISDVHL